MSSALVCSVLGEVLLSTLLLGELLPDGITLGELLGMSVLVSCEVGLKVSPAAVAPLCWLVKLLSSVSIAFSCAEHATHTRTVSSYAVGAEVESVRRSHDIT